MANDLVDEKKNSKGKGTGEYYVRENPPPLFSEQIGRLCNAMRNWPKRCVFLGAEGSRWPVMKGVGRN
eukprot:4801304-Alexandrium_andersonii.AAC.1